MIAIAEPPVIDDQMIVDALSKQVGDFVGKDGVPSADDLSKNAGKARRLKPDISIPTSPAAAPENNYETLSRSVYLVGSVYKCGKCSKWHEGGTATAWCLSPDGLMVTNAHVFKGAKGGAMGVTDREGHSHPVTELLGYDITSDVAVFRVRGENLRPLRLGATANVGDAVTVISHPHGHYFTRTAGSVARYSKRPAGKGQPQATWLTITADYAKGSSGGPVFNASGEVVGMVSSTHSIYTESGPNQVKGSPKGELQMVIRYCVPVAAIRALFENPAAEK